MIRTSGRVDIVLSCTECKSRNYKTTKRREIGANVEEVTLKKFCKKCQKHTVHKETK